MSAALLAAYAVTLMPGVPPTDSGEMTLAAWLPGIAHAPGFPFYTVAGWAWSHALPVGRIVWRLNLFSAVCGAAAAGLAYALALRTLRETGRPAEAISARAFSTAATGALAFGLGRTVWNWSTVAEVYALNLLLAAAILLLVIAWTGLPEPRQSSKPGAKEPPRDAMGKRHKSKRFSEQPKKDARGSALVRPEQLPTFNLQPSPRTALWPLIAAAFLFGLGLGNHLTSIALLAPAIAFWLTARRGWRFWISRTALLAALALAAGFAIYLYLPLRAAADPLLNWGKPDTWLRFWWHVTARQYRVSLLSSPVGPQVIFAAKLWWTQFTPLGLALLLLGAWRMGRSQPRLFWMLALVIVFVTLYAWAYVIEDDGDAYYLPAFLAASAWVGWGARAIMGLDLTGLRKSVRSAALVILPALVTGAALIINWAACDRHADTIPEDYARDALAEIGSGGLLLTRDWQFYAPALYLQKVEGLRPDVTVIDAELLRRDWYFDLLHKTDPGLMASVATEEAAYRSLRDAWERGDIPDGDPRIGQLQAAYVALLDAFIDRAAAAARPVHIGPNRGAEALRDATLAGQPDMEAGAGADWRWIPIGLSFRALPAAEAAQVSSVQPLSWRVEPFGRVIPTAPERKIQATRADMATLHGLVQANLGNLAAAEADWRLALTIEPTYAPANELLDRLKGQQ